MLSGKIALVTGASRGIGRAIALRLAGAGALVGLHYRQAAPEADSLLRAVRTTAREKGGDGFLLQADLSQRGGAARLAEAFGEELQRRFGDPGFDILVNNAGIAPRAVIEEVSEDSLDTVLQVNLKAPFLLIQTLSPHLRTGGRIVNMSSMVTRAAYPEMAAYAPSKAAIEALTLLLAAHFGPRGITVNAVRPGATATDMNPAARDPETSRRIAGSVALGRVGQPDDIAEIVAFLASDAARWITGQCIDASGGQRL